MSIKIYESKIECCGCGACENACSQDAIQMKADKEGFIYPLIDKNKCVECGECLEVCGYKKIPLRTTPINCYAVASVDEKILKNSSSGGFFSIIANYILNKHGVVYGVEQKSVENKLITQHIRIHEINQLVKLQGSKYVQSNIGNSYRQVKEDLENKRYVLFTGTPCQNASLIKYLGYRPERLITMEIICHGVPSEKMFQDFLYNLRSIYNKTICKFEFRSKKVGQGINTCVSLLDNQGNIIEKYKNGNLYSYVFFFLKGWIYRINCYSCPFATSERIADFTVGDYWGFHQEHPNISSKIGLNDSEGISCVLINSQKGQDIFAECRNDMFAIETEYEKIRKHNEQLYKPCNYSEKREEILQRYLEKGYEEVEHYYRKISKIARIKYQFLSFMPKNLKRAIKKMLGFISCMKG